MTKKMLKIIQVRSSIGCAPNHKLILRGLGLRHIGSIVYRVNTASILGMLRVIKYLVKVEYM